MNTNGYSFIEVVLYIAISSIVLTGLVQFGWLVVYRQQQSAHLRSMAAVHDRILHRLQYELTHAKSIQLAAGDTLCFTPADQSFTRMIFFIVQDQLWLGKNTLSLDCTNPEEEVMFSDEAVLVKNLNFEEILTGDIQSIQYSFTLEHATAPQKTVPTLEARSSALVRR
jgi:hypothetical protein